MNSNYENALTALGMGDFAATVTDTFALIDIAEEEVAAAQQRHPSAASRVWHAFRLLTPPEHEYMRQERPFRAHCREILDRVAVGADTRTGTAAEVCVLLKQTSLKAPLTSAAFGLYARMWVAAGLPDFPEMEEMSAHHEALESSLIDDHEQTARRQVTVRDRQLGDIECSGRHHGEEVDCDYATAPAGPAEAYAALAAQAEAAGFVIEESPAHPGGSRSERDEDDPRTIHVSVPADDDDDEDRALFDLAQLITEGTRAAADPDSIAP